jgi:hypothetical protein
LPVLNRHDAACGRLLISVKEGPRSATKVMPPEANMTPSLYMRSLQVVVLVLTFVFLAAVVVGAIR